MATSFCPRTPPVAFFLMMAKSTPRLSAWPKAAASPDRGPNTPSFISALAETGRAMRLASEVAKREFDGIVVGLSEMRAGGLVIAVDSFFTARREQLAQLALRNRVPAIYQSRAFAEARGVMSYGGSLADGFRLVGLYMGRILKGNKPADLPVQQTTKAELII